MDNLSFSILTITFCSFGYYFSWRYWTKDNYKIAVLLLIVCGLVLRIYTSMDFFLHSWDERYHALVAKNLLQHPLIPTLYDQPLLPYDYKNWTANHIWLHKQPLPLWIMSFSMWLFGINEIALRIPSIILTTIGIWLTFSIGRYFFNNAVGYLAAFLFSINGLIIELTGGRSATDHIDTCFLFFTELAVYFSIIFIQKNKMIYNVFAGICIGAAILSKWLPALIVIPIWLLLTIESKNFNLKTIAFQFLVLLTTCLIIFLPWQIYIYHSFPLEASWESALIEKHFTENIEGHGADISFYLIKIGTIFGELAYLPLFWFLWKAIKNPKDKRQIALLLWFWIPLIIFSLAKTKMSAYILLASPAVLIMISKFLTKFQQFKPNYELKWIINLILIFLIALPIRYTIERTRLFKETERNPQWVTDLKNLNNRKIRNGVLFNCDKPIETMFYTNLIAYPDIPKKDVIIDLIEKGHTILIKNDEDVPEDIKSLKNVLILN